MKELRILQVHNSYLSGHGGEDTVAALEADLLSRRGHTVKRLLVATSPQLRQARMLRLALTACQSIWSQSGYVSVKRAIQEFRPHVVHVHNTFPLLSPSVFWAIKREGLPVVETLHNFRHTCANALLMRNNRACQDCVGHFPFSALRHRCYQGSLGASITVSAINVIHRALGTFSKKIDAYIALNEFSREIFVRAGLPTDRVLVKPNFLPPLSVNQARTRRRQVVFAGIIARHKGVHMLIDAWSKINPRGYELVLIGEGPERPLLESESNQASITWRGAIAHSEVLRAIATARFAILPSICYENSPMVVLEALSAGTPVIVPDHGAFPQMVTTGVEGLMFRAGDVASLSEVLLAALSAREEDWWRWSSNAKARFDREFGEEKNYDELIRIYDRVLTARKMSASLDRNGSSVSPQTVVCE